MALNVLSICLCWLSRELMTTLALVMHVLEVRLGWLFSCFVWPLIIVGMVMNAALIALIVAGWKTLR